MPCSTSTTSAIASLLSSMPPSTDCSAATSCGGCRSYCGAVGVGRLKSSATATGGPPSTHGAPAHRPRRLRRGLVGEHQYAAHLSRTCVRDVPTPAYRQFGRRGVGEDVRKSG